MKQYEDPIWDVAKREADRLAILRGRLDQIERTVAMGKKARALEQSMGYQDFVNAVESVKQGVMGRILATKPSDDGADHLLWELKGKAQGLNDVLALLTNATVRVPALEAEGKKIQNAIDEAIKRTPKPRTKTDEQ